MNDNISKSKTNIKLSNKYKNPLIFGPIASRRFGISLGIDLSPDSKQCNFDCLYCELEGAKTVESMSSYPSVEDIILSIKNDISQHKKIDVLTITANGEPTLYPKLDQLIDSINLIKGDTKTLILSNGANIYDKTIQKTLTKIDIVKLSLDCVSNKCFKKLDRIHKNIDTSKIVDGMIEFSKIHKNSFVLEILFVKDLNDNNEELELLYKAIKKINPHRVDIGTINRPPAYKVKPISYEKLDYIASYFKGMNINIVSKNSKKAIQDYNQNEIIALLQRRPLTLDDINNLFTKNSIKILKDLVSKNIVYILDSAGVEFYKVK